MTPRRSTSMTWESMSALQSRIRGRVHRPGDDGYDEARTVVSGTFDARPAVIIRAAAAEDVARVIALARESGLELSRCRRTPGCVR